MFHSHERSLVKQYQGRPFVILGVNIDETREEFKDAVAEERLTWRSWYDGPLYGPIARKYRIPGTPSLFLIDPQGKVQYALGGMPQDMDSFDEIIDMMVKEAEAGPKPTSP
jgi:thioredoxin-related protein